MRRKAPGRSKGEWRQPTHRPLHWNPSWLRAVHAYMGGPWDKTNVDSEPGKARWLAKGNLKEMPHISDSNYHEGATLSLSPAVCLTTHTLFPPNKHFPCFTTFQLFVEIYFYKADKALSLALVPCDLVARIQRSHRCCLTSVSGRGTEILLQAAAGWGHPRSG